MFVSFQSPIVMILVAFVLQALHRELCDVYRRLGELSGLGQANDAGDGGWTASGNSNAPGSSGAGDRESTSKTEGANGDQVARAAKLLREAQNAFAWPRPATVASATAAANSAAAAAAAGAAGTSTATGGGDKGDEGSVAMATLFSDAMTAAAGGKGGGFASSSSSREAQVAWAVQGILEDCQRQQQRLNEHSVVLKSSHKQHDNVDVQDSHDNNNDDEDCDVAFGDEDVGGLLTVPSILFQHARNSVVFVSPFYLASSLFIIFCPSFLILWRLLSPNSWTLLSEAQPTPLPFPLWWSLLCKRASLLLLFRYPELCHCMRVCVCSLLSFSFFISSFE